ncbi:unnamed protein product [Periconia digitata]|uniref:Uncharacterized protein n=1 Tax=Periconia digitata TaxID=1303443 RepID=A0A9W4USK3_9PLEO|nr:unnamed protein product [Periconia digitata]
MFFLPAASWMLYQGNYTYQYMVLLYFSGCSYQIVTMHIQRDRAQLPASRPLRLSHVTTS